MSERQLKKQRRKEKREKIKTFLSDKRNKAIVKLGIYFIFILFVVIYVRAMNSKRPSYVPTENLPQTITDGVKNFKSVNSYEYSIEYNYNGNIFNINGKKYNDKWLINYNDINYYYDGNILINNDTKEEVNKTNIDLILMFDVQKVYDYLLNSEYVSKTENVNNELIIKSKVTINNTENEIETINKDNNLESINVNLTNYYKLKDENCLNLYVSIKYSNLNNIEEFN